MIRLLSARLLPYRSFAKFSLLQVMAVILLIYVVSHFSSFSVQGEDVPIGSLFSRPQGWQSAAALVRWLFFIPAFFTVQLICAELELKIVRAQLIAGLERHNIVAGWTLQNSLLAIIGVATTVVATLAFCKVAEGGADDFVFALAAESGLFLYGVIFLNCAMLCAVFMRRPIPALVLLIAWPLVIESLIGVLLDKYVYAGISQYLPFSSFSTLASWPKGPGTGFDPTATLSLLSIGYGVLVPIVTWWRLRQIDL
jgi:ABC-type transport system involved in multi-copper enzyme maturation permease subunit